MGSLPRAKAGVGLGDERHDPAGRWRARRRGRRQRDDCRRTAAGSATAITGSHLPVPRGARSARPARTCRPRSRSRPTSTCPPRCRRSWWPRSTTRSWRACTAACCSRRPRRCSGCSSCCRFLPARGTEVDGDPGRHLTRGDRAGSDRGAAVEPAPATNDNGIGRSSAGTAPALHTPDAGTRSPRLAGSCGSGRGDRLFEERELLGVVHGGASGRGARARGAGDHVDGAAGRTSPRCGGARSSGRPCSPGSSCAHTTSASG